MIPHSNAEVKNGCCKIVLKQRVKKYENNGSNVINGINVIKIKEKD